MKRPLGELLGISRYERGFTDLAPYRREEGSNFAYHRQALKGAITVYKGRSA